MDELIYSFLLQSGFPRASILLDLDLLGPKAKMPDAGPVPSFAIVDPETAELLSVIQVVDAVEAEALQAAAIDTQAYASRLGARAVQCFVIRVDVRGSMEEDQVRFFRVRRNKALQQLSSKSFPDLETLRVARKLLEESLPSVDNVALANDEYPALNDFPESSSGVENTTFKRVGPGLYFPGLCLLGLIVADTYFSSMYGTPLLSVSQSVMAFGAALLLTLPALIHFLR